MRTGTKPSLSKQLKKKLVGRGLLLAVFLVLLSVVMALLGHMDNRTTYHPGGVDESQAEEPVRHLKTYLFMGIDDNIEQGEDYVLGGMCDVLQLLVVDEDKRTYTRLPINRDTVMDVHSYDMEGEDLGTTYVQISFAHSSGTGGEDSCEYTCRAVSDLLQGAAIDGYIAMNMESIGHINRLVEGVTVTIEDDFSESDATLVLGETLRLSDEQAYHYLHDRMNVGDGSNESRMRRQAAYLESFQAAAVERMRADNAFALESYEMLRSEMVTDLSGKEFSRLANDLMDYESNGKLEIKGENSIDEFGFMAFTPDPDSLQQVIAQLFGTAQGTHQTE